MEMNRALIILLCATGICFGQLALNNAPFAALLNRTGTADTNTSWFLNERFEAPGYQYAWTSAGATLNDASTTSPAPLEGSYSLRITESGSAGRTTNVFNATNGFVSGYFLVNFPTAPSALTVNHFFHFLSNSTPVGSVSITLGNVWMHTQAGDWNSLGAFTAGTSYQVWVDVTPGGDMNLYFDTAAAVTKPASPRASGAFLGGGVNKLIVGSTNTVTWTGVFDKIILSTTNITGIP